jgi:TonB family protein
MPSPKGCKEGRARMLDQLEQQGVEEQHLQPRVVAPPTFPGEDDQRQRRRMVIALILLLVALGLVLVKDRDFWFPATDTSASDAEAIDDSTPIGTVEVASAAAPSPEATSPSTPAPMPVPRKKERPALSKTRETAAPVSAPVTNARAVLPPLRVEVEAGGRSQFVKPGSPSVRVVMQPGTVVPQAPEPTEMASVGNAPLTNAGERIQMSSDSRQVLSRSVRPEYPLLARQMKVQGRVDLEASIGKDGGIRTLNVLAGPTILADAAREAVKQWRFKPHLEDGQPVETQVPITVNFTISTR